MYCYQIKENGEMIGVAIGKHKAFEFIQKEVDRSGLLGYWKGETYISPEKQFTIERAVNE